MPAQETDAMFHLIRTQLERTVPFHRVIGLALDAVDARSATARLPEQPTLANHQGTLHAGALFTACESASGAALAGALLPVIVRTRFVVRDARIAYLKPARGDVLAQAALTGEPAAGIDALQRDGRATAVVDVSARIAVGTADERIVAQASFEWHLKLIDG
jgi:acyl-coenzyme A thioesterase PaaI-like protein